MLRKRSEAKRKRESKPLRRRGVSTTNGGGGERDTDLIPTPTLGGGGRVEEGRRDEGKGTGGTGVKFLPRLNRGRGGRLIWGSERRGMHPKGKKKYKMPEG